MMTYEKTEIGGEARLGSTVSTVFMYEWGLLGIHFMARRRYAFALQTYDFVSSV